MNGETHRLDGRSDIWGLGVTMYELFTGQRPFQGANSEEIFESILTRDPKPLRQLNPAVSPQLERICLRCLVRTMSQRYLSAADVIDDISEYREDSKPRSADSAEAEKPLTDSGTGSSRSAGSSIESSRITSVVPKGLRAFDGEDADFFLELLPGPRDRLGLPEQVRFWKARLEARQGAQPVCVLYGPSGCGKSSLVNAGIIPLLQEVRCFYVEASTGQTVQRLSTMLGDAFPFLSHDWNLPDRISALRQRMMHAGAKVVIFVDQLEQWMHGRKIEPSLELIEALRQCDGNHVQAVLMVRDDFWMPTSELMRAIDVPISEGENAAAIHRFSIRHARKVLTSFGRAYGAVDPGDKMPSEQRAFIRSAVDQLSEDETVPCVHLALFADMMKSRPWVLRELRAVGGAKGVGTAYLERTFSSSSASAKHRNMEEPVMHILEALLPARGVPIKGHARDAAELKEAAGLRDAEFREVMRCLDQELRIITAKSADRSDAPDSEMYQLTHDFIVAPIREWIHRKRGATWQGRAALRLEERSQQWESEDESSRFLPSPVEYATFLAGVSGSDQSAVAKRFMRAAWKRHGLRSAVLLMATLVIVSLVWKQRAERRRERVQQQIERLMDAKAAAVVPLLDGLRRDEALAVSLLHRHAKEGDASTQWRYTTALMSLNDYAHVQSPDALVELIRDAPIDECENLVEAFRNLPVSLRDTLDANWESLTPDVAMRLAVVNVHLGDAELLKALVQFRPDPRFRLAFIHGVDRWESNYGPLIALLSEDGGVSVKSAICKAFGRIDPVVVTGATSS